MREKPAVSFLLIDWGVRESFHILHYLSSQSLPREMYEIIVIEYYSHVSEAVKEFENVVDSWLLLGMNRNTLYHKHLMYNVGIIESKGNIVVICDSDAMVRETFVKSIMSKFDEDPKIILHMDQFRNNSKKYYPFNYPTFDDVLGEGCDNNVGGVPRGIAHRIEPLYHSRNYGACMCARREDLIGIGGADEDLCYLGYICGPYDMTFRLRNQGLKEVWHDSEFLFHTWHPGADGTKNYMGPHDGERMSSLAIESLKTGRTHPFRENRAIFNLRTVKNVPLDISESDLIAPQYADEWEYKGIRKREEEHLRSNPHPYMIDRRIPEYSTEGIRLKISNLLKELRIKRFAGFLFRWSNAFLRLSNTRAKVKELEKQLDTLEKRLDTLENGNISSLESLQNVCMLSTDYKTTTSSTDEIYLNISKYIDAVKCSSFERKFVSQFLADEIEKVVPKKQYPYEQGRYDELTREGIITLDDCALTKKQIEDINSYFSKKKVFNSWVYIYSNKIPYEVEVLRRESPIGSYRSDDTINAPHLLDLALNPKILGIVEKYLGCTPTIYSMNSWRYFPGHPIAGPQNFHRDIDDYKFLALFVFLSDVKGGDAGGQFQHIRRTHDEAEVAKMLSGNTLAANEFFPPKLKNHGYQNSDFYRKIFSDHIVDFSGRAGSVFLADTFGLHRGVPPQFDDRFVCWIRYGYGQNWAYKNDGIQSVKLEQQTEFDPYCKFVTRNIIKH